MSRALPATPPNANDKINSTGYSLFDILLIDALRPIIKLASPKPVKSTSLYFSLIPLCRQVPTTVPITMVQVFTMVPNICVVCKDKKTERLLFRFLKFLHAKRINPEQEPQQLHLQQP